MWSIYVYTVTGNGFTSVKVIEGFSSQELAQTAATNIYNALHGHGTLTAYTAVFEVS
jgi:hypothetical protein